MSTPRFPRCHKAFWFERARRLVLQLLCWDINGAPWGASYHCHSTYILYMQTAKLNDWELRKTKIEKLWLWRRGIPTASQLFDDDLRFNFSHMACLVSLVCTMGQLCGSWGYITIRLYIWELSVLDTPRRIKATESTGSYFCCWSGREDK